MFGKESRKVFNFSRVPYILYYFIRRQNSAQMMAVAVATFSDSEVGSPIG